MLALAGNAPRRRSGPAELGCGRWLHLSIDLDEIFSRYIVWMLLCLRQTQDRCKADIAALQQITPLLTSAGSEQSLHGFARAGPRFLVELIEEVRVIPQFSFFQQFVIKGGLQ